MLGRASMFSHKIGNSEVEARKEVKCGVDVLWFWKLLTES
jgi:hypothetical protein